MYIEYKQFIFWYLTEERLELTFITLLSSKGLIYVISIEHTVEQFVEAQHFKSNFASSNSGGAIANIDLFFPAEL